MPLLCESVGLDMNTADELRWSVPQVAPPGDPDAEDDAPGGVVGVCGSSSNPCALSGSGGDFKITDLGLPFDVVVVVVVVAAAAAAAGGGESVEDDDEKNDIAIVASLDGVCVLSRVRPRGFFVTCSGAAPSGKHSSMSDAVLTSVHCGY